MTKTTNHYIRALAVLPTMLAAMVLASGVALAETNAFSNSSPIQIPDSGAANPYPSQIFVGVFPPGTAITDVNLKLNGLSHISPQDVDMILQHGNQSAIVMSDVINGGSIDGINLTLDDEATNLLPLNDPLLSDSYQPTDQDFSEDAAFPSPANNFPTDGSTLSVFDGMDPNGFWNLWVVDDAAGDSGQFAGGWSLEISTGSLDNPPDTTAPKVINTIPAAGATGVAPAANVRATFSEEMMASSISTTTFKLFKKGSTTKLAATVSYDTSTDTATLDPTNSLRSGVTYKAVVTTGVKDLAGNQLDQNATTSGLQPKTWLFTVSK